MYEQYKLYKQTNEVEKTQTIAELILDKPVKIMSPAVLQIKKETRGAVEQEAQMTNILPPVLSGCQKYPIDEAAAPVRLSDVPDRSGRTNARRGKSIR